ncbi:MAG: class I SAM-dependent methyltransferase [Candidatus Competibacteraceae bacterium]|nr:MAG: class I SAM-dependent methyltransferase [Candidatus Competibacteraceae bacterium]
MALITSARGLLHPKQGGVSNARRESNAWLRQHCMAIQGKVLSIGSGNDSDGEGSHYRDYFAAAVSYTTSEVGPNFGCDLVLDVRSMPELSDGSFDCVYCSGVLEHVDDFHAGFAEITRILADGGTLLLGLPFRQPIHMSPNDFWRFTEFGIRRLLRDAYEIQDVVTIDTLQGAEFPAAYWAKAIKKELEHSPTASACIGAK